jgi:predicted metal-dependent phosphoesterase TrpH
MRLDLHCHTRERSSCSHIGEEALVRRAIRLGLDGVAFTDHNCLPPPGRLDELNREYRPFRVFTGIEISLMTSESWQDFLVLGLSDSLLETADWTYPKLLEWVRRHNGWLAMAHPFRYRREMPREVADNPPDALEMYSTNISPASSPRIETAAREMGCQVIGTSDAHLLEEVGYYTVVLTQPANSEADLVAQLKKGAFQMKKRESRPAQPGTAG